MYVFDISQTEGEDLPEFATLGGDPGSYIDALIGIYQEKGIQLNFGEQLPRDANGMFAGRSRHDQRIAAATSEVLDYGA